MIKTPEHRALEKRARETQIRLHDARIALATAKREALEAAEAVRLYRSNHRAVPTSRIGPKVLEQVAGALSVSEIRSPPQIAKATRRSVVAVRLALKRLVEEKRAQRLGKPGQRTFYRAVPILLRDDPVLQPDERDSPQLAAYKEYVRGGFGYE